MLSLKLNVLKLVLSLLTLSACTQFPTRPNGFVYNLDTKSNLAYEMSVPMSPYEDVQYTGKDVPLGEMDKYFCVSPDYLIDLKHWMQDVVEQAKEKCNE